MERRQTKLYRVIHLIDGRVFDIATAEGVANHLFVHANFDIPNYRVYKRGVHWRIRSGEVGEIARALETF